MPKILFFLLVSSLFVQTFGVLLPVQGNVQLITNLHRFSPVLESVKSILGSNVQITNVLKFNNNACQFFKESYDLTIFVSDSNEICNVKTGKFSIQLVVHQDQVQFHYKTRSGSIKSSPKMKSESTIVENYMKIIFYDFLNDEFTKTGSLSHVETSFLKSITLDLRSWTYFLLGALITGMVMDRWDKNPRKDDNDIQQQLEDLKPDEIRHAPKKTYPESSNGPITRQDFKQMMKLVAEFVVDYCEHPEVYEVVRQHKFGTLFNELPKTAPKNPESFTKIMKDVYHQIMMGLVHMQHPRFVAYYVIGRSYPDILAEIITSTLAVINPMWDVSPSLTELEMAMINWLGRAFDLPETFLFNVDKPDNGGGVMLDGGSESILLAMLTARHKCLTEITGKINLNCRDEEHKILTKLVAYASKEAHSSTEKAAMISLVHMRPISTDENFSMRGINLEKQIIRDIERGLRPFYVHVTLGTTATCAFDNLKEIVMVAKKYKLWVHVDASYAGNSWVCPEYRYQYEGIHEADSINVNLHKMFLNGVGSTVLFVRDSLVLKKAMTVNPVYLKTKTIGTTDFRFWGVPLCRRTKSLKVWFVLRMYGISGLQKYVRHMAKLANRYKDYLEKESRLEIIGKPVLGLVCFRIKSLTEEQSNKLTIGFAEYLNISRKLVVTPAKPGGIDVIRIAISHTLSSEREVDENYEIIHQLLNEYLKISEPIIVENAKFKIDPGIIGSPGLSTASTPRTTGTSPGLSPPCSSRSTTFADVRKNNNYMNDTNTNSSASLNLRRDIEELKRCPELEIEKTPSNNSNSIRKIKKKK